jgi:glycosyltransferase involved in cell wall biosynthesis
MPSDKLKVLLIVEQCNPEWSSVPLEGYRYYKSLSRLANLTLVTHERNRSALHAADGEGKVVFISETWIAQQWSRLAGLLTEHKGRINWPIRHALNYPIYAEFNSRTFHLLRGDVAKGVYDVVHAVTPILPRYPVKMIDACRNTPFLLGPVNGGLAFPDGFPDIAGKEFDRFSFLRSWARMLPGYRRTYRNADKILAGSTATLQMVRKTMGVADHRIELLHENGVPASSLAEPHRRTGDAIRLLFVGRLVSYKCADVVIEAIALLPSETLRQVSLTIVGDGPEREGLELLAGRLSLADRVNFAGWVPQEETAHFYRQSDIFCFPSVREFGGAVVLEAMAAGLPCIVADYGGIAEYVTEETGFRIALRSREYLVQQTALHIQELADGSGRLADMSARAVERARGFTWESKARRIVEIYAELIERKRGRH